MRFLEHLRQARHAELARALAARTVPIEDAEQRLVGARKRQTTDPRSH